MSCNQTHPQSANPAGTGLQVDTSKGTTESPGQQPDGDDVTHSPLLAAEAGCGDDDAAECHPHAGTILVPETPCITQQQEGLVVQAGGGQQEGGAVQQQQQRHGEVVSCAEPAVKRMRIQCVHQQQASATIYEAALKQIDERYRKLRSEILQQGTDSCAPIQQYDNQYSRCIALIMEAMLEQEQWPAADDLEDLQALLLAMKHAVLIHG